MLLKDSWVDQIDLVKQLPIQNDSLQWMKKERENKKGIDTNIKKQINK